MVKSSESSAPMPILDRVPHQLPSLKHRTDTAAGGNLFYTGRGGMPERQPESAHSTSSSSKIISISGHRSRDNSFSIIDKVYPSHFGTSIYSCRSKFCGPSLMKSDFRSLVHDQYQSTTQTYDESLLQKLDAGNKDAKLVPRQNFLVSTFTSSNKFSSPRSAEQWHSVSPKAPCLPITTSKPSLAESPLAKSTEPPRILSHTELHPSPTVQELDPENRIPITFALETGTHKQKKQYRCPHCRNRFKNKNEARRHQASIHLRRHSWSCFALSSYKGAFYQSSSRPGKADTCGYCGEEFLRSGILSPTPGGLHVAEVTEQDWKLRMLHLQKVHKYNECNVGKKFFRADHFRQHLKHSHASSSGPWTNTLEVACMKDEPLSEPI